MFPTRLDVAIPPSDPVEVLGLTRRTRLSQGAEKPKETSFKPVSDPKLVPYASRTRLRLRQRIAARHNFKLFARVDRPARVGNSFQTGIGRCDVFCGFETPVARRRERREGYITTS